MRTQVRDTEQLGDPTQYRLSGTVGVSYSKGVLVGPPTTLRLYSLLTVAVLVQL